MLTGKLPFEANSLWRLMVMHAQEPPPQLRDPELNALAQACLAKRPEDRPADFSVVRSCLEEIYRSKFGGQAPAPIPARNYGVLATKSRAVSLVTLGQPERAIPILQGACRERPDLAELWACLGHAFLQAGRAEEAREVLGRALRLEETASIWVDMGLACELLSRGDEAEGSYLRALELDPEYASAYYSLACMMAGDGRPEAAVQVFQKAVQLAPSQGMYRVGLGMALFNLKQYGAASEAYRQCLAVDSTNARAWFRVALCELTQGDERQAELGFKKAAALEPGNPRYQVTLAKWLQDGNRTAEAVAALEEALQVARHPQVLVQHGLALLRMGRSEEGLRSLAEATDLGSAEAAEMLATLRRGL